MAEETDVNFDQADEIRRQAAIDRMEAMAERAAQAREAQEAQKRMSRIENGATGFTSNKSGSKDANSSEDLVQSLLQTAQEISQRQSSTLRMKSFFDDSTELARIQRPDGFFDRSVNQWLSKIGPACEGMRFVSDYVADYCLGMNDMLEQYSFMKNANSKTIAGRCDPRNPGDSMFNSQDKFRHCLAYCDSSSRGPGGQDAARLFSWARETRDLIWKPASNTFSNASAASRTDGISAWAPSRLAREYATQVRSEWIDSGHDIEANEIGIISGQKGLRCRDACAGYQPIYVLPRPMPETPQ